MISAFYGTPETDIFIKILKMFKVDFHFSQLQLIKVNY